MNSSIFVQPSIGIPAGPIGEQTASKSTSGAKESGRKPVAAVIRPMPRGSGREGSIRVDAANSAAPNKPHVRKNNLDDYVRWLREKNHLDQRDTKPVVIEEVETEVVAQEEQAHSSESDTGSSPLEPISLEYPSVYATQNSFFSLMTHEHTQSISTEAILQPEADEQTLSAESDPPASATLAPREIEQLSKFAPVQLARIDAEHPIKKNLSSAHVSFAETATSVEEEDLSDPQQPIVAAQDTEQFIKTVSQAIASVLTETPEPAFEQKIREHFETELHARAIQTLAPWPEDKEVDRMDRASLESLQEVSGKPVLTMQTEAEKVAREILSDVQKEIPATVAAWDVEDFRWPAVTNQMIVSGGTAIDHLTRSVLDLVTPGNQRIAIAAMNRGEGATSIAISMARWAAASGSNVLLVDADITSPSLSSQVGLASNLSWLNAVSQSQPPAEVIVRSQSSNLCIMPLADMVSKVTWPRFIYDNLGDLIDQVRGHFDVVILDMGPASQMLTELSKPGLLVDATLLVHGGIATDDIVQTKSRLEQFGVDKFVIAQNRTQQRSANVA
ncbi:MAG: tyrosine-protein kinase family protein [Mariniblastus sp.]